jgi:D-serine deaminase-like pyridoxal phosphate-dependent protein
MPVIEDIHNALGENSLTLMVDHPDQVELIDQHANAVDPKISVFIKIDTGYHRAGVLPDSPECDALISRVLESERSGNCFLHGLYSHASHSYNGQDSQDAISVLCDEFEGIHCVARSRLSGRARPLVLSVGATPTATAVQNPGVDSATSQDGPETRRLRDMMAAMKAERFALEVHAGVYPTLDLQQLATHARGQSLMTHDDIALTILAEVVSLYPGRGQNDTTEALITAGSLALGREPVQGGRDYSGWGVMTPWRSPLDLRLAHARGEDLADYPAPGPDFPRGFKGWEVGRISQEHGVLVWKGRKEDEVPLKVGQKIRIWPNHACIAGAGFDHYVVIDSSLPGHDPDVARPRSEEVLDMWSRIRGW